MTKKELDEMIAAEEKRLGVGSEEFMKRHNEIMEEADRIQKREQEKKDTRQNMEALKEAVERLDVRGKIDTCTYGHMIIVRLDQKYLGTFNTNLKRFIDIADRIERSKRHDENGDGEQVRRTGTQTDGDPSAEQYGQQAGAGSGGKDHSSGDGGIGDSNETADRGGEADTGDADDQGGSRPDRSVL